MLVANRGDRHATARRGGPPLPLRPGGRGSTRCRGSGRTGSARRSGPGRSHRPGGRQSRSSRLRDVARRRILESAKVAAHDPVAAPDADVGSPSVRGQRRHDVSRGLDRAVEDDHDRPARAPDPDVPGRAGSEPLARADDLDLLDIAGRQHLFLPVGRTVRDHHDRRALGRVGLDASKRARDVLRPVGCHDDHGRGRRRPARPGATGRPSSCRTGRARRPRPSADRRARARSRSRGRRPSSRPPRSRRGSGPPPASSSWRGPLRGREPPKAPRRGSGLAARRQPGR
jgi:hypothetical protein